MIYKNIIILVYACILLSTVQSCRFKSQNSTEINNKQKTVISKPHDFLLESRCFEGHTKPILCVAFSPDNRLILSTSTDRSICVWDIDSGRKLQQLKAHDHLTVKAVFLSDSKRILTASKDGTICLWNIETGEERHIFEKEGALCLKPLSDGQRLLFVSTDNIIKLINILDRKEIRRFVGHKNLIFDFDISSDERYIISGSMDQTIRLWDLNNGNEISVAYCESTVSSVAFSIDNKRISYSCEDSTLRVREINGWKETHQFIVKNQFKKTFSSDGRKIFIGGKDGTIKLFEMESGVELTRFLAHKNWIFSLASSPNDRYCASGGGYSEHQNSGDTKVCVWKLPEFNNPKVQFNP